MSLGTPLAQWKIPYRLALVSRYDALEVAVDLMFTADVLVTLLCALQTDLRAMKEAGHRRLTLRRPPPALDAHLPPWEGTQGGEGGLKKKTRKDMPKTKEQKRRERRHARQPHFASESHGYLTRLSPLHGRAFCWDVAATSSMLVAHAINVGQLRGPKPQLWVWWAAALLRLCRLPQLTRFFRERELDFHAEARRAQRSASLLGPAGNSAARSSPRAQRISFARFRQ